MSKLSRVFNILKSVLMILLGIIILLVPDDQDYIIVCLIIGIVITFRGIRKLIFYISSARNMVGGGRILINSLIYIDVGLISFFVLLEKQALAMLYLVGLFILWGAIDVLRSFEIKKNESKSWISKFIKGLLTIGVGLTCLIFANSISLMLLIFGISFIVLAVEGIVAACSKSAVTYIPEI